MGCDSDQALFAHCVGLTVNAVHEAYNRRPKAIGHADRIAEAVSLDMAAVGWRPTAEAYLGRVTKGRILAAVREARGARAAERIAGLKKAEMATRDLITLVKHSKLKSRELLGQSLYAFVLDAKKAGKGLAKLTARINGAVDK